MWVGVDAVTRQPICLVRCFTHKDHGERAQVSAQAEGGGAYTGGDPVILTDRAGAMVA